VRRRLPFGHGVALTFDDGPSPDATPRILDALGRWGARATFFVLGEEVARYPDIARRIIADGHAIGIHGWDHRPMTWVTPREALALMQRARDVVEDVTGRRVCHYRAPWGHRGPGLGAALRRLGWRNIGWRLAARDWRAATPNAVARRVLSAIRPRDIILLHDGGPGATVTVSALPDLLAALERRGLGCDVLP
jgi:peptidoglycan/xylan/chitin deacetylase (PgdA/CDA1 family)